MSVSNITRVASLPLYCSVTMAVGPLSRCWKNPGPLVFNKAWVQVLGQTFLPIGPGLLRGAVLNVACGPLILVLWEKGWDGAWLGSAMLKACRRGQGKGNQALIQMLIEQYWYSLSLLWTSWYCHPRMLLPPPPTRWENCRPTSPQKPFFSPPPLTALQLS